jgi:hypothetical protein
MARAQDRVVIGFCHPTGWAADFGLSLVGLMFHDFTHDVRVETILPRYSSANISTARNWIVREFLETTSGDWLLFLDVDMVFRPTLVDDMLAKASMTKAPVVGGLCFGLAVNGDLFPTLYGVSDEGGIHTIRYVEYPRNTLMPVAATGAACLLIHRTVLERVRDAERAKGNEAYPWFQETTFAGHPCGEDITFCHRVGALDIPVHVDTGVALGHQKTYTLTETMYREQRADTTTED